MRGLGADQAGAACVVGRLPVERCVEVVMQAGACKGCQSRMGGKKHVHGWLSNYGPFLDPHFKTAPNKYLGYAKKGP